jgi:hypothetical protein
MTSTHHATELGFKRDLSDSFRRWELFGLLFAKHRPRWTVEVTKEDDGGKPAGGRQRAVRRRWGQRTLPYRHEDAA